MSIEQHNPMHPGVFIKRVYLEPFNSGAKGLAERLRVSESVMSRIQKSTASRAYIGDRKCYKLEGKYMRVWRNW